MEQSSASNSCNNEVQENELVKMEHSLASDLGNALKNKLMTDINIVVGEKEFACHRLILSASSSVFQVMLMNRDWNESEASRVVLVEPKECAEMFQCFLEYIYTRNIYLTMKKVLPILILADKYNVQDLIHSCITYMKKRLSLAIRANVLVSWIHYSQCSIHLELAKDCLNFAKWNFSRVACTEEFKNSDSNFVISLLRANDLVVKDERCLFRCIEKWATKQRTKCSAEEDFEKLIKNVLLHIRFPMMSTNDIAELLLCPLSNEYKEFFFDRMAMGMAFISDSENILQKEVKKNDPILFTPRLYVADNCTLSWTHEYKGYAYNTSIFEKFSSNGCLEGKMNTYKWNLNLHPTGGSHGGCFSVQAEQPRMIILRENTLNDARLCLTCTNPPPHPEHIRMKIGILLYELVRNQMYVKKAHDITYLFSKNDHTLTVENILEPKTVPKDKQKHCDSSNNKRQLKLSITAIPIYDINDSRAIQEKTRSSAD